MGSLSDTITEKEQASESLEAQIADAEADAAAARAALQAIDRTLAELKQVAADVAASSATLERAATDAKPAAAAADAELVLVDKLLEAEKAGLPAALDQLVAADLPAPPDPNLKKLADYDAAVKTAADLVAGKRDVLTQARAAKADAVAGLELAEAAGLAAAAALKTAAADLAAIVANSAAARADKRVADLAVLRFQLQQQDALLTTRSGALAQAKQAVATAADAVATRQLDVEKAEKELAAEAAKLTAAEMLAGAARSAVEKALRAATP